MRTYICIRTHIYVRVIFPLYFAKRLISKVQKSRAGMKYVLMYLILLQINFVDYVFNYRRLVFRSCYRKLVLIELVLTRKHDSEIHTSHTCVHYFCIFYLLLSSISFSSLCLSLFFSIPIVYFD